MGGHTAFAIIDGDPSCGADRLRVLFTLQGFHWCVAGTVSRYQRIEHIQIKAQHHIHEWQVASQNIMDKLSVMH